VDGTAQALRVHLLFLLFSAVTTLFPTKPTKSTYMVGNVDPGSRSPDE
jgi:hypothetical protein